MAELLAEPLLTARTSPHNNKLSNLQRLAELSSTLEFTVPETHVLASEHFWQAVEGVAGGGGRRLLIETLDEPAVGRIRQGLLVQPLPEITQHALQSVYDTLNRRGDGVRLCVRSLFELEDQQGHSFAGIFETVPDICGLQMLCRAVQVVFASMFSDRAMAEVRGAGLTELPPMRVAIQEMVGGVGWAGGVAHTQCPELAPFPLMLLSVSYDSASVTAGVDLPEEYLVHRGNLARPDRRVIVQTRAGSQTGECLRFSDDSMRRLASTLMAVEQAFDTPVEVEWLVDPQGRLYVLQARPLCIHQAVQAVSVDEARQRRLCAGLPVGNGWVCGTVRRVASLAEARNVPAGHIIVTDHTDPDWTGIVRRAAGVITAIGARTSHVSRTAREAGVLAVVGCGRGIKRLKDGMLVTLACAEGLQGVVYEGDVPTMGAAAPSTEDAFLEHPATAFAVGRHRQPRHVYFNLSDVVAALRLPARGSIAAQDPSPRIRQRIAGHLSVEDFARQKLVEAACLVSTAFPAARLSVSLDSAEGWGTLLPDVIADCRTYYGVAAAQAASEPDQGSART